MKAKTVLFLCVLSVFQIRGFAQNSEVQTRLKRAISIVFHTYDYTLSKIDFDQNTLPGAIPAHLSKDEIFKLKIEDNPRGYVYLGHAPSKERDFDYMIVFDPQLVITKVKVLIYREQRGREIGSKRWLKQFEGRSPKSSVEFKKDIDGISGATISARSMTVAVGKALKTMGVLKKNNLL